jgi:hypothetical protein
MSEETPKLYRYYFINRPPSYGARPDRVIKFDIWDPRQKAPGMGDWTFWGWADYAEPLISEVIWGYELRPADQTELEAYLEWREENQK